MAVDRWTQINELFHAVIALDSESREAYLAEVCAGDAGLRQELAHLVAGYKSAEASMQTDFLRGAIQELAQEDTLTIGQISARIA